jgi:hypothetical protein
MDCPRGDAGERAADEVERLIAEPQRQRLWGPETGVTSLCRDGLRLAVWPVGSVPVVGRWQRVVVSFLYWSLRRLLELVVLGRRSEREKEIEFVLLRRQLWVVEGQVARPRPRQAEGALLAAFRRVLSRPAWWRSFLVGAATVLRWDRELVARRWRYPHRRPGRPATPAPIRELVVRLGRENPGWG